MDAPHATVFCGGGCGTEKVKFVWTRYEQFENLPESPCK